MFRRALFKAAGATGGDPFFSNVSLLLPGAAPIVDKSPRPKALALAGNAAYSEFLEGSIAFDGNGDFIQVAPSAEFAAGTGDFSVETIVYPTAYPNDYHTIAATRGTDGIATGWSWNVAKNGSMILYTNQFAYLGTVAGAVPLNTATFVQLIRSNGLLQLYANGVPNRATPVSVANNFTLQNFCIGTTGGVATGGGTGGDPYTGFVKEFRFTKGVARPPGMPTFPLPDF